MQYVVNNNNYYIWDVFLHMRYKNTSGNRLLK